MRTEMLKKTEVLAEIMLILLKLCSLVRQIHDYKHCLQDCWWRGKCKAL